MIWAILSSIAAYLHGQIPTIVDVVVVSLAIIIAVARTPYGEKWFGHRLERNLSEFKNQHSRDLETLKRDYTADIEKVKAQLGHLGDRGKRSNEREYAAITVVWEAFVDAFVATLRCIMAHVEHPDLSRMSDEELKRFLGTTEFSDEQKESVIDATDKNRAYSDVVYRRQVWEAGKAIFDARSIVRKQSIFIPVQLQKKFEEYLMNLSKAQIDRSMDIRYRST